MKTEKAPSLAQQVNSNQLTYEVLYTIRREGSAAGKEKMRIVRKESPLDFTNLGDVSNDYTYIKKGIQGEIMVLFMLVYEKNKSFKFQWISLDRTRAINFLGYVGGDTYDTIYDAIRGAMGCNGIVFECRNTMEIKECIAAL